MHFDDKTYRIVDELATDMGVETPALMAVIEVESGQSGFVNDLITIRWEGHYFWRLLSEGLRDKAFRAKLAHPRAQHIKNPRSMKDRHALLDRAREIDAEAALKSVSMGMGQVMGSHAERLGYYDVFEMWEVNKTLGGQIETMARYIERFGLVDELKNHDWAGFARGYNGPNYQKFQYDRQLRAAYARHCGKDKALPEDPVIVRQGDNRKTRVKSIQSRLRELGYHVSVDGDFGPATKRAVQMFQIDNGLSPDGIVGVVTLDALDRGAPREIANDRAATTEKELVERSRIAKNGANVRNAGIVTASFVGAAGTAEETGILDKIGEISYKAESLSGALRPLKLVVEFAMDNLWVALVAGGIAFGFWGSRIVSARLEDHRTEKTL